MKTLSILLVSVLSLGVVGCKTTKKTTKPTSSNGTGVTDLGSGTLGAGPVDVVVNPNDTGTKTSTTNPPANPVSAKPTSHVVVKGDTLYSLSKKYYNDPKKVQKILDANPGVDAKTLKVGQTLVIPQP